MNQETALQLMDYGRVLMKRVAGGEKTDDPTWVKAYLDLLNPNRPAAPPTEPLQVIFTLVNVQGQTVAPAYLRPVPLDLSAEQGASDWVLMPADRPTATAADRTTLYRSFAQEGGKAGQDFTRFFYLMRKYASTLPNDYGEPGVSLFEQWKIVAALVVISGDLAWPPEKLGLVGGDIPGIQRTINLVTSKGAAKAMRGRSAFIQLLGHALVERLLDELGLGSANVVYDAGGNFVLLTNWDGTLKQRVRDVANQVNRVLLVGTGEGQERFDGFHGDLAVALDTVELPLDALRADLPPVTLPNGDQASRWQLAEKKVKDAVAAAKARPFGDLALESEQGWHDLFDLEPAETDDFCAVCRRQRRRDEKFVPLDPDAPVDVAIRSNLQCPECAGFGELARSLGHRGARLLLSDEPPEKLSAWQRGLHAVTGRWYRIGEADEKGAVTLALNLAGFPAPGVDGFRLLARTTPMTGRTITPNEVLADASRGGLKRLGVLRMDVDNLGNLLVHGLPQRTPMQTAELSQALEWFFAGWLGRICDRVDEGRGLFYVLFAGGDDLFVIGPWDRMPELAWAIREEFRCYTADHAMIHLSAGIAVVGEKAPMVTAVEQSHEALEDAKKLNRNTPREKNAITFLGRSYHWKEFGQVQAMQQGLVRLVKEQDLPGALLTTLLAIERRYRRDWEHDAKAQDAERKRGAWGAYTTSDGRSVQVYYGPWMWRQAYALARLKDSYRDARQGLEQLEAALLDGRIADLGLAARWAQWLTRKER